MTEGKTIREEARRLPVALETDVLVVGGGLAGVAAAVAAARAGAKATILEKSCVLGGLATLGHVCIYLPLDDGIGHKIYGGLAEELLHVCIRYGYDDLPDCWREGPDTVEHPTGRYRATFNIPACVLALDEYLANEGVQVIFDTAFCAPIMELNRCRGVIVENKSGRQAYLAKMVIDASGDADVLYRAGAACQEQKSIVSHWAYEFDVERVRRGTSDKVLDNLPLRWFGLRPDRDNSASTIPTFYGTTVEGVNDYIRVSRGLALDYLKQNQREGFALLSMPYMPQFRMTRRLCGLDEMRLNPGVSEPHSIGAVIHCLEAPAAVYEFPYEALIDRRIENIAAAGRMVSAGGRGWEIMRCIPNCVLTGQAAGLAAAMAAKAGCTLRQVDVPALQAALAETGVKIHMPDAVRENHTLPPVPRGPGGKH